MKMLGYHEERWSDGVTYTTVDGAYLCFLPAPERHLSAGYHRQRVGLNHLAFSAASRRQVDEIAEWVRVKGYTALYASRYPHSGGPNHYAAYFEDPDRIKVEVVAPRES